MKFNMGCGTRKQAGFVNVDASGHCTPDIIFDLETAPWPWPSDSAEEIVFNHSLEHMGRDPAVFLAIIGETWRIAADGCHVQINVPHPRHDNFVSDPTHVRAVTPQMMRLFDRRLCDLAQKQGAANTPFATLLGVDFELLSTETVLDEPFLSQMRSGALSEPDLRLMIRTQFNIARELKMTLRVHKPPRASFAG